MGEKIKMEEEGKEMELMNINEAATFLKVNPHSVRRWSNSGLIKCYRIGKAKLRRFKKSDLLQYLEEHIDHSGENK